MRPGDLESQYGHVRANSTHGDRLADSLLQPEVLTFKGEVDGCPTTVTMTRAPDGSVTMGSEMVRHNTRHFPEPDPGGYSVGANFEQAYNYTVEPDESAVLCETTPQPGQAPKQFWLIRVEA